MADVEKDSSSQKEYRQGSETSSPPHEENHHSTEKREDVELGRQPTTESVKVQWTFTRCVAIASLCISYVGSQILLYFVGGGLSYIAEDVGIMLPSWLPNANLLSISATLPFVGYFTDLVGRRWTVVFGSFLLVLGAILEASCYSFAQGIMGMIFGGIGAGICELTAFAGVSEITPVKYRGVSLAFVTISILPFCPYVLYVQLLQKASTWRWGLGLVAIWNAIGLLGLIFCYHPPPRHTELSRKEIAKRIDWIGALLSIAGLSLFLVGLQAGGYQFPWKSPQVLAPLIIGILVLIAFPIYEMKFAKYPIVPKELFKGQRVMALSFVIAFVAGMNFYSVLNFFPILLQYYYPPNPILVGERAMGYGFSILFGACLINALLSYTRGRIREMITISCLIMTGFGGAIAACTPYNPDLATALSTIAGFGIGGVLIPATTLSIIASPDEWIATATAIALCVRFIGGAIGNTIYFNIYNNQLMKRLPQYIAEYATRSGLPQASAMQFTQLYAKATQSGMIDPSIFANINGATQEVLQSAALGARFAYADSLRYVWYVSIAFGAVACVCCCFLPNMKHFLTNRVAVDIH